MNKMQMAHEYMQNTLKYLHENNINFEFKEIVIEAFDYADAMQAEADKRNKAEAEQKRKEVREILKDANTFIEREGQNFDDVEWQPDWSQAPNADAWRMYGDGNCAWLIDLGDEDFKWFGRAPSFNYQGNWQDSLRKRPESTKNIDPKEYIDAVLQDIVDPCDHEWTHISKFGAEGDFYVCPCGAKSKNARGRK